MNVLMLTAEFIPTVGGISTYVVELCKRMPSNTCVHVLTPKPDIEGAGVSDEGKSSGPELPRNIHVHNLGTSSSSFFGTFPFQLNCGVHIRKIIRDYSIDIVHSQSSMPDYLASKSSLEVPIVTTIHTTIEGHIQALRQSEQGFGHLNSSERFALLLGPLLTVMENRYYRSRSNFITVSEWGKKEVAREKGIDESMIRVTHNGVDPTIFRPDAPRHDWDMLNQTEPDPRPTVLFLSRLATRKGIHILAEAIPKILKRVDCKFIIGGLGEPPEIRAPRDSVKFLGYVPSEIMPQLYAYSDIFVLPSYYENLPISILEAMASECAVVATDVCGVPEMITHGVNGRLTRPGDVDGLVNAVSDLVRDERLRASLGTMARREVLDRFTWEQTVALTTQYYEDIISRGE